MADRGRPRAFDRDEALRRAMTVFWMRGYEGASIGDLTEAMGINKPSLYASFGCKEELFRQAVRLYGTLEGEAIDRALTENATARAAIEAVLRHNARAYVDADTPPGCMIVLSALMGTPENREVRQFMAAERRAGEEALRRRIERGVGEGDVPAGADAALMAAFYTTVIHGLSVEACDGASREVLEGIVDGAMAAWDALADKHGDG